MKITRRHLRRIIKEELTYLFEQAEPIEEPSEHAGIPSPVEPGSMRRYRTKDAQGNIWVIDVNEEGRWNWGWILESRPKPGPIVLWDKEWSKDSWIELRPNKGLRIYGEPADGSEAWRNAEEIDFALEGDSEVFDVINTHYDLDPAHMFLELATAAGIPEIEA